MTRFAQLLTLPGVEVAPAIIYLGCDGYAGHYFRADDADRNDPVVYRLDSVDRHSILIAHRSKTMNGLDEPRWRAPGRNEPRPESLSRCVAAMRSLLTARLLPPTFFSVRYIKEQRSLDVPSRSPHLLQGGLTMARSRRTKQLRVGFDLDGPCYNFLDAISRYLLDKGVDAPLDKWENNWHGYRGWGLDADAFRTWCDTATDEGFMFLDGDPAPGAVEATHLLAEAGHTVHIVTARDYGRQGAAQRNTARWLDKHDFVWHSITFDADKTIVPTHLFIEDNLHNYDALHAAGSEAWLVDMPYNQDEPGRRRKRVENTLEFAQIILDRTKTPGIPS